MYIVATGKYRECWTDYVINTLDDIDTLLLDKNFLDDHNYLFDEGITGHRFVERKNRSHPIELVIQYWDGYDYEETTLYLFELKVFK